MALLLKGCELPGPEGTTMQGPKQSPDFHFGFLEGRRSFGFRRDWTGLSQQATTCRTIPPWWHGHSHFEAFIPYLRFGLLKPDRLRKCPAEVVQKLTGTS